MTTKDNLKNFYNSEAKKYYATRNKPRSDGQWIINEIINSQKKEISILEFGCGWWRCIQHIKNNLPLIKINYIWIDLSDELLKYAQKDNPKLKFICDDISNYIKNVKQESFDFIIWIASFQHIPTYGERLFLMKHFYRCLKYWWKIIMTNRAMSKWFIKKYKKEITLSCLKSIYTFWKRSWRDLQIPRKNSGEIKYRYYHIFSKKELSTLANEWWFLTHTLIYLDKKWKDCTSRQSANNTLLIGTKWIYKQ